MSLGGSLIVPEEIDIAFIKSFVSFIKNYTSKGYDFLLIVGGGKIARKYGDAVKEIVDPTNTNLDWLGIAITKANAELVRISFGDLAYERIIENPENIPKTNSHVIVGGGWKPGNSSDLAAIRAAKTIGAKTIINLTNIDYVYDSDPKSNPEAKPVTNISWIDFLLLFPDNNWTPGSNRPFDPIASCEAQTNEQEVIILNGRDLDNIGLCLEGKTFKGTVIK